jgi:fatty acid desaturase
MGVRSKRAAPERTAGRVLRPRPFVRRGIEPWPEWSILGRIALLHGQNAVVDRGPGPNTMFVETLQPGSAPTSPPAATARTRSPEAERLARFAEAIEAIGERAQAKVGAEDVAHLERIDRISKRLEVVGRTLIHFSLDPITFGVGVGALWAHKQLQVFEVGHTALHGALDAFPEASKFHSRRHRWEFPVDERTWMKTHFMHHGGVNTPHKDDLFQPGFLRIHSQTHWLWYHRFQVPYLLLVLAPSFGLMVNAHITGLNDIWFRNGTPARPFDFVENRSLSTIRAAYGAALRKYVPYYAKNYLFYPLLAGPFFPKVFLGNFLAETMRDLWTAAVVLSNHVADTTSYPEGTQPKSRGEYLAMQVEATHDFAVSAPVSLLCGGLDYHIEHHLFPRLPPNRLREIQPEVEAVCKAHGVRYKRERWPALLRKVLRRFSAMSRPDGGKTVGERLGLSRPDR